MKSRLKFGMSLAFDFDMYISDEVTAAGDVRFRKKAREALKRLADHAGLIMASHSEKTLCDFCSTAIWLHEGKAHWYDNVRHAIRDMNLHYKLARS